MDSQRVGLWGSFFFAATPTKQDSEMSTVICKQCGAKFAADRFGESSKFDHHDCPNVLEPREGESFEDYSARCASHAEATKEGR